MIAVKKHRKRKIMQVFEISLWAMSNEFHKLIREWLAAILLRCKLSVFPWRVLPPFWGPGNVKFSGSKLRVMERSHLGWKSNEKIIIRRSENGAALSFLYFLSSSLSLHWKKNNLLCLVSCLYLYFCKGHSSTGLTRVCLKMICYHDRYEKGIKRWS